MESTKRVGQIWADGVHVWLITTNAPVGWVGTCLGLAPWANHSQASAGVYIAGDQAELLESEWLMWEDEGWIRVS